MDTLSQKIRSIQKQYWSFNKNEKELLLAQFPHISEWKNVLRLHHLLCMEVFQEYSTNQALVSTGTSNDPELPAQIQETINTLKKTTAMLLSDKSPYLPQACEIKYDVLTKFKEFKKLSGTLTNASLSHLGSLEVLRVDAELNPSSIDFIPFSSIKTIMHNSDGTLISYKGKKERDICYLATHYYFSEESTQDTASTMTTYIFTQKQMCKLVDMYTEDEHYCLTDYGLGSGPQEFTILHNDKSKVKAQIHKNAVITMIPHMYEMKHIKSTISQSAHMI